MNTELMTPFSEAGGVDQPLSLITIQSLADLGYVVDPAVAETYSVAPPSLAAGNAQRAEKLWLGDDVIRLPIRRVPIRN